MICNASELKAWNKGTYVEREVWDATYSGNGGTWLNGDGQSSPSPLGVSPRLRIEESLYLEEKGLESNIKNFHGFVIEGSVRCKVSVNVILDLK